jgi:DNA polymerase eta
MLIIAAHACTPALVHVLFFNLLQGKDDDEVKPRTLPKSISCGKTFRGASALTGLTAVHSWLQQLATELQERLEADRREHQRIPSQLTVSIDTLAANAGGCTEGG